MTALDPEEINPRLAERSQAVWNPLELGPLPAPEVRRWIEAAMVPDSWWRVLDGRQATEEEKERLLANCNLENVADFQADRYGITVRRSGLRALPTSRRGQKESDEGFDRLQHTALEPLTPLALLHRSRDGKWWFALAPDYRGWVKASDVATSSDPGKIASFLPDRDSGRVLVEPLAELETSSGRTPVQTGDLLPINDDFSYPARGTDGALQAGKARLPRQVRTIPAFPELTPETLFSVALTPLGQPYGWGDLTPSGPGRDCSRFVQDTFKAFGFRLPRDASKQCAATQTAIAFAPGENHAARAKRLAGLKKGPALLCMPGHIMLYLGEVNGCHHAVHSFWAYKKPTEAGEETVPVRRVVVSSLDLGLGTSSGSLLERLTSVNLL